MRIPIDMDTIHAVYLDAFIGTANKNMKNMEMALDVVTGELVLGPRGLV